MMILEKTVSLRLESSKRISSFVQSFANLFPAIWKERWAYILLAPSYILFIIFALIPLIIVAYLSFTDADLGQVSWIGLKNYNMLLTDHVFRKSFFNTVKIAGIIVPVITILSLTFAVLVQSFVSTIQALIRAIMYLPRVANAVVMSLIFLWMFNPSYGLLNYLLSFIGIDPVPWLTNGSTAVFSIILVEVILRIGRPFILFLAGLYTIPEEISEAAIIDGATEWQRFRYVTLPLLTPITLFVVVTETASAMQIWASVFLLTDGGPVRATDVLVYRVYETAFEFFRFGYASAQSTVLLIASVLIIAFQFRQFRWEGN